MLLLSLRVRVHAVVVTTVVISVIIIIIIIIIRAGCIVHQGLYLGFSIEMSPNTFAFPEDQELFNSIDRQLAQEIPKAQQSRQKDFYFLLTHLKDESTRFTHNLIQQRGSNGRFQLLPDRINPYESIFEGADDPFSAASELVPIRIEAEIMASAGHEPIVISDIACINNKKAELEANLLARSLVTDYKMDEMPAVFDQLRAGIMEQLKEYDALVASEHRMKQTLDGHDRLYGSLRVPIRIDITIDALKIIDKFEWSLETPSDPSPESVAEKYAIELGLPIEFR